MVNRIAEFNEVYYYDDNGNFMIIGNCIFPSRSILKIEENEKEFKVTYKIIDENTGNPVSKTDIVKK